MRIVTLVPCLILGAGALFYATRRFQHDALVAEFVAATSLEARPGDSDAPAVIVAERCKLEEEGSTLYLCYWFGGIRVLRFAIRDGHTERLDKGLLSTPPLRLVLDSHYAKVSAAVATGIGSTSLTAILLNKNIPNRAKGIVLLGVGILSSGVVTAQALAIDPREASDVHLALLSSTEGCRRVESALVRLARYSARLALARVRYAGPDPIASESVPLATELLSYADAYDAAVSNNAIKDRESCLRNIGRLHEALPETLGADATLIVTYPFYLEAWFGCCFLLACFGGSYLCLRKPHSIGTD
jgi:hypothetical protein